MKTLITASLAVVMIATGASATGRHAAATINKFAPNADVSRLSAGEIAHIMSIINDDGDDSITQTKIKVRALIRRFQ